MSRSIQISVSLFWMAFFAIGASTRLLSAHNLLFEGDGVSAGVLQAVLALVPALAAALFAWLLFTTLSTLEDALALPQVTDLAFGVGVLALMVSILAGAVTATDAMDVAAAALSAMAALMASYLAVRWFSVQNDPVELAETQDRERAARVLALKAAHGTMVDRLATPTVPNGRGGD
ncbi:hypothetical protein [Nitratireductor basaltis]|uniref:Transmembrane protein n=1 Tax=Nitratireductor basaltis TaxID=472175 RepID=A0A084UB79_9HYPH|nr:hypothetical protein [Nitratireductor basaltis]KFB10215.1 hypothetical protein EL18_01245 [Nitratireductor basaltis]